MIVSILYFLWQRTASIAEKKNPKQRFITSAIEVKYDDYDDVHSCYYYKYQSVNYILSFFSMKVDITPFFLPVKGKVK